MNDFMFCNSTRIVFGKNAMEYLPKMLEKYGAKRVLLHYGGGSVKTNGVYDGVVSALKAAKVEYFELGGVQPNPRLSLVNRGIETVKEKGVDFILAVGGGSVIDSAKAIGVGYYNANFWDELFMTGGAAKQMLPLGAVLTLSATGSESSTSCVVLNDKTGLKRSIGGEALLPKFAILNPEFTYSVSKEQTANGSCDIFAHLLERYFSPTQNVEFTDNLIEAAMKTVIKFAPAALKNPQDYDARSQLMWTGTLAHNNLLNTGRLGDWASHKIEHGLSGVYDTAHGMGLAIVFPAWMKYVYRLDLNRFARLAANVFGADIGGMTLESAALEGIKRTEEFFKSLGLKIRLSDAGIDSSRFKEMAEGCLFGRAYIGEFKRLNAEDVENIYKLAL